MNKFKAKFLAQFIVFAIGLVLFAPTTESAEHWRLDGDHNKYEPRSFRFMTDAWHIDPAGNEPSREGMDTLKMSASGQPSLIGLNWVVKQIKKVAPSSEIYLVDLRQESHGYVNDAPISWYTKHNRANFGKSTATVQEEEKVWLSSLVGQTIRFVPMGKSDTKLFVPLTINIRESCTEEDAALAAGMNYARFAVTDSEFPEPPVVDDFLRFARNLPDNAWLHFHCHAGHGRTTTFAVMYDKLQNPQLDIEILARRQYLLGGTNIFSQVKDEDWYVRAWNNRAAMLRRFDDYVNSKTELTWSEWLRSKEDNHEQA